ncbi:26895_t:CDS:2, partial [Dentiscutata erythropus]
PPIQSIPPSPELSSNFQEKVSISTDSQQSNKQPEAPDECDDL